MKRKSSLQWRVVLTIVAVGMFPLAAVLVWAGYHGKSVLVKASGEKFTELAKQMATQIDFLIDREIHEAQSLALSEELRRAVSLFDGTAGGKKDAWISADRLLTENSASRYLRAYQNLKDEEYEIIFATDHMGNAVASTLPLRETNLSEQAWWQAAYGNGKGAIFVTEMYWVEGNPSPRMDLALPIFDQEGQQAVGVLKFVIKDLEMDEILREFNIGQTGHAMLVSGEGRILICPIQPPSSHRPIQVDKYSEAGWVLQSDGHDEDETVVAFSEVPLTREYGTQDGGIKPWHVAVTQQRAELFAPIRQALWTVSGLGAALMGILVLLGILAGRRLVRPILALQENAELLARGDLSHRLRLKSNDELETLAHTVNQMAEKLQRQTSDLIAARDYLRSIIEQSAALIITTNPAYEIKEFNRGAEEVLGYRRKEVEGEKLEIIWDDPQECHQVISQVTLQGQRIHYETVFSRRDGTPVPVSCSLSQIADEMGKSHGLVLVGGDLTDRKELEASKLEAERLLALHRISTLLTHDLRSPMVGILKALSLLKETYGKMPDSQAHEILSDLMRGGDLLMGTLNDLLDVYRHSLSALPLRRIDFSLNEAIQEIVRLMDVDAQARKIKLEAEIDSPEVRLFADRRRLQRVLFNLLDNATKYSPSGGRITLRVCPVEDDRVSFYIDDEGPGIPETEIPRIFDFLYQTSLDERTCTERSGMGVGLYFCRVTVEAHAGTIKAENRARGGARFTVSLPVSTSEGNAR